MKYLTDNLEDMNLCNLDGEDHHLLSAMTHLDNQIPEPFTESNPQPKAKPKRRKKPKLQEKLSCHVCGDIAGKHSYYGAQACYSCRAFFRRAIESGYRFAYVCAKNKGYLGQCTINLTLRKKCQYCRYQACLVAGMKTSWVLNEEEKSF